MITLAIWVWPKSDLEAYNAFCSRNEPFATYKQFQRRIAEVIKDSQYPVELVPMTVATMLDQLHQRGLSNTPENRAAVVGGALEKRIGVKIDHDAVGWTILHQEGPVDSGVIPITNGVRDAVERLLESLTGDLE